MTLVLPTVLKCSAGLMAASESLITEFAQPRFPNLPRLWRLWLQVSKPLRHTFSALATMLQECPPLMGVGGWGWFGNRRETVARHVLSERHSDRNHFSASCLHRRLCLACLISNLDPECTFQGQIELVKCGPGSVARPKWLGTAHM